VLPAEPVTQPNSQLAQASAIEQVEHDAMWARSNREYQEALDRVARLRRGERVAAEPPPPVPVPPATAAGWDVRKTLQRDPSSGLIVPIVATWCPATEPA